MVKQNLGKWDRWLWIVIGLFLVILAYYKVDDLLWKFIAYFLGIFSLISGFTGWSLIYFLFGHSSKGHGIDKITKRDIERAVKEYGIKVDNLNQITPEKPKKSKASKNVKITKKTTKTTKKVVDKSTPKTTKKAVKKAPAKKTVKKTAKKAVKK